MTFIKRVNIPIIAMVVITAIAILHPLQVVGADPASEMVSEDEILIVGDRELAPLEYIDQNGMPAGFMVDMVKHILDRKGVKYQIRLRNHALSLNRLISGEADLMLMVYNVNPEDSLMLTSRPFGRLHHVVVCDKNMKPLTKEDLKNYNVLILDESMLSQIVEKYIPEEKRVYADNVLDALKMVQNERYDMAIVTTDNAQYYMSHYQFPDLEIRQLDFPWQSMRVGINLNRPDLQRIIDEGLDEAIQDGSYHDIYLKWYGYDNNQNVGMSQEMIYLLVIGGLIFMVMLTIICYTLVQSGRIRKFSNSEKSRGEFYKNQTSTLLDSIPVGVAIYDDKGHLKYINRTLAQMFSINNIQEYVAAGHNLYDNPLVSEHNKVRIHKGKDFDFILTYNSDIDARFQYAFVPPEDSAYFECKIRHVRNNDAMRGDSIYFVLNDITNLQVARKNLENQSKCLNLALIAGNLRVWRCDVATSMIYAMYKTPDGKTPEAFTLRSFFKSIHPDDLPTFLEVWDNLLSARSEGGSVTVRLMDESGNYTEITMKMMVVYESLGRRSQTMQILMVSKI